jgi:hypothetical protein
LKFILLSEFPALLVCLLPLSMKDKCKGMVPIFEFPPSSQYPKKKKKLKKIKEFKFVTKNNFQYDYMVQIYILSQLIMYIFATKLSCYLKLLKDIVLLKSNLNHKMVLQRTYSILLRVACLRSIAAWKPPQTPIAFKLFYTLK